ncbi:MAG TPA: DUF4040 domain-containing protein [Longimicrobiales bacterium]|nr:DUF4040 domain-containing protein [Longimicrobiales bacterium]
MIVLVDIGLLVLLAVTALTIIRQRNLFAATMLAGIYSLLSAGLFVTMDAMDVAFTEAAVGAGISTVLILGTLALVGHDEARPRHRGTAWLPLVVVAITGAALVYGTLDMPPFGSPDNPAHQHVAPYYIEQTPHEIGMPNIVTAVLASYRGYDTMGETSVVFTALVGVLLLIARGPRPSWIRHQGSWWRLAEEPGSDGVPASDAREPAGVDASMAAETAEPVEPKGAPRA